MDNTFMQDFLPWASHSSLDNLYSGPNKHPSRPPAGPQQLQGFVCLLPFSFHGDPSTNRSQWESHSFRTQLLPFPEMWWSQFPEGFLWCLEGLADPRSSHEIGLRDCHGELLHCREHWCQCRPQRFLHRCGNHGTLLVTQPRNHISSILMKPH